MLHTSFSFWGTDGRREHYGNAFHCTMALKVRRNTTPCILFKEINTSHFEAFLFLFFVKCPPEFWLSVFQYTKKLDLQKRSRAHFYRPYLFCFSVFSEQLKIGPKVFGQRITQSHWQVWNISAQTSTGFWCNWRFL